MTNKTQIAINALASIPDPKGFIKSLGIRNEDNPVSRTTSCPVAQYLTKITGDQHTVNGYSAFRRIQNGFGEESVTLPRNIRDIVSEYDQELEARKKGYNGF